MPIGILIQSPDDSIQSTGSSTGSLGTRPKINCRRLRATTLFLTIFVIANTAFFANGPQLLAQTVRVSMLPKRIPAPSLDGGGEWINTAGPIALKQLRGKLVILDFWTYCCINCLQTLPDLKKLEEAYPNEVVVIGVHSAKFFTERDADNVREAVIRYEVDHPVINDANQVLWRKYDVKGWPSLRFIDPEGFVIAAHGGEITFEALDRFVGRTVASYKRKRLIDETPLRFDLERRKVEETPLRFPGKVLADESSDRLFIADSGHNRIVIARLDGTFVDAIGTGAIGRKDGGFDEATFDHPQGLALHGDVLYVADVENHLVRQIDLKRRRVSTVAGTGEQGFDAVVRINGRPTTAKLASPWALWIHEGFLYIAMAGNHQIWRMSLTEPYIFPYAGNGIEDIVDGPLLARAPLKKGYAAFAQPSGLASDGTWLYVADSEGSSIRAVPLGAGRKVLTVVGTAHLPANRLFTFGDVDGPARRAMLQHPLGLAHHRGQLFVADTFNNKIKAIDLKELTVKTVAGAFEPGRTDQPSRFDEPAGLSIAGSKMYVADTNNHSIRVVDLVEDYPTRMIAIEGLKPPAPQKESLPTIPGTKRVEFDSVEVKPDDDGLRFAIDLILPEGHKINTDGPMSYVVDVSSGDKLIASSVAGKHQSVVEPATKFEFAIPLDKREGRAKINVTLTYYYCHEGAEALCKVGAVNWSGQVTLSANATSDHVQLKHFVRESGIDAFR